MTWFAVDEKLHDHRKSRRAGIAAMGLWSLAGSWCSDHLTDGFVPESIIDRWSDGEHDARDLAARLVAAGYWRKDREQGERGWRFHQWDHFQPTRAEVIAQHAKKVEAGKKGGLASGIARRRTAAEAGAKAGASEFVAEPLNPDPTRPGFTPQPPASGGQPAPSRCQRHKARKKPTCPDCHLPPITRPDATPIGSLCEHTRDRDTCPWCNGRLEVVS